MLPAMEPGATQNQAPRSALWAFVAGIVVTLGLPPVPGTGALVPLGLGMLFVALHEAPQPGRTLWIFAVSHQTTLLHWLFFLIPAKTIPTRALVPIQGILAILYVTVFYLLLGWLWGLLRRRVGGVSALLVMPALWTGMEALRARGEMAFPWCLSGSAVIGGPLMGLLRASGEIGVSALMASVGVAGALLWIWRRRDGGARTAALVACSGAVALAVALGVGSTLTPPPGTGAENLRTEPLRVAAVQADVSLEDKWQVAKIDSSRIPYAQLTEAAAAQGAEFVVWAETAIPAYVRYDRDLMNWVRDLGRDEGVFLYAGFPDARRNDAGEVEKFNSSGLFDRQGILIDRYAKHHLLPIGEAMPFTSLIPALAKVDVGQAEWTPGPPPQPMVLNTPEGNFPFSGLICFESILAAQARDSVRRGSRCLVVLTNDGWFGQTAGPRQHSALARLRAAESSVPVVRCANNGISFLCDASGRMLVRIGLGERGQIQADLLPGSGATAYVRWGAWPLFWWLLLSSVVGLFMERKRA